MKVTKLYYLTENLRYILLSEHMYFPGKNPFSSDWVTNIEYNLSIMGKIFELKVEYFTTCCSYTYQFAQVRYVDNISLLTIK